MRKPAFCICENKEADQLRSNCAADQRLFFFAIRIVQYLYYLNPKFQASSHLLWLSDRFVSDLVGKPRRPVFSHKAQVYADYMIEYT